MQLKDVGERNELYYDDRQSLVVPQKEWKLAGEPYK